MYEFYVGFYTHKPFWAGINIIETLPYPNWEQEFTELMGEVVYEHETADYNLKICRDGLFLFQHSQFSDLTKDKPVGLLEAQELSKIWADMLVYLNAILILFESAFLNVQKERYFDHLEITIKDAFSVTFSDDGLAGFTIPKLSLASHLQTARFLTTFNKDVPLELDSRIDKRTVVSKAVFDKLFREFEIAFHNKRMIHALAKLAKSLGEYKSANYDTSLIISWFIIEATINDQWEAWLKAQNIEYSNGSKRINRKRLEFLTGREFSISIISNILELTENLPYELFVQIDKIRNSRNKIVHSNREYQPNICDSETSASALDVVRQLIGSQLDFEIDLNTFLLVPAIG